MAGRRAVWSMLLLCAVIVYADGHWLVALAAAMMIGGTAAGVLRWHYTHAPDTWEKLHKYVIRPMLALSVATMFVLTIALVAAVRSAPLETPSTTMQGSTQNFIDWAINELSRRVTTIEGQKLDSRVAVLESDMFELKWMLRGVLVTVVGQFFLPLMGARKKDARESR